MRKLGLQALGLIASLLAGIANAGDDGISLGVSAGSLGVGPEASIRAGEFLGVRVHAGLLGASGSQDFDGIDYEAELNLRSAGAMLDWYPLGGGFRISAGAYWNGNELDLSARPSASVNIGGTAFTPAEIGSLDGTLEVNALAPALSLGFAGVLAPGLTLGLELGVLYQGAPQLTSLSARGGLLAGDPALLAALAAEADRIEAEIDAYRFWPVAQLLFVYRF